MIAFVWNFFSNIYILNSWESTSGFIFLATIGYLLSGAYYKTSVVTEVLWL